MPIGPARSTAARVSVFLASLGLAQAAGAAPHHPRDPGDGVVRLRSTTFLAGWTYDDEGRRTSDGGFVTETVSLHVEAGVAPRLTLTAEVPFVWVPERGLPSPGDAVLGGMVALLAPDAPVDLAVALDVKLPLYPGAPSIRGRASDGLPAIGDGQVDTTASVVLVGPLPLGGAIDLYAGYRLRTGGVTDAVVGGGRAGVWLFDKRLFVSALLDTVVTFDPASGLAKDATPDEIMGRGYAAGGARVSVRLVERTFLEMTALYVGRGQNAAGGAELGVGVSAAF